MSHDDPYWSTGQGIGDLSQLLKESQLAEQNRNNGNNNNGGESVAPMKLNNTSIITQSNKKKNSNISSLKDIWNENEIPTEDELIARSGGNTLPTPQYEFRYKQSIGTEETFFGFSDKTPASWDCTHLVIKIHFPGSRMRDLDLDVTKNRIKAESRTHKLFTYLPVNVFPDKGDAKFDSKKEVLTVTLPIDNDSSDTP
mmetsp:Transcript_22243/g.22944  ORF Transcript_22243/g.22944 Transcript_22243/m.22944 type:complete len:198 (-) Transcript_22243:33-626(-)